MVFKSLLAKSYMGAISKDREQIILYYHSENSRGKLTFAYVVSSKNYILTIYITKITLGALNVLKCGMVWTSKELILLIRTIRIPGQNLEKGICKWWRMKIYKYLKPV